MYVCTYFTMQHTPPLFYCLPHLHLSFLSCIPFHPLPPQCPLLTELHSTLRILIRDNNSTCTAYVCKHFPAHNWSELTLCNVALFYYYFLIWKILCNYYAWSVYISSSAVPCPTGVWPWHTVILWTCCYVISHDSNESLHYLLQSSHAVWNSC